MCFYDHLHKLLHKINWHLRKFVHSKYLKRSNHENYEKRAANISKSNLFREFLELIEKIIL